MRAILEIKKDIKKMLCAIFIVYGCNSGIDSLNMHSTNIDIDNECERFFKCYQLSFSLTPENAYLYKRVYINEKNKLSKFFLIKAFDLLNENDFLNDKTNLDLTIQILSLLSPNSDFKKRDNSKFKEICENISSFVKELLKNEDKSEKILRECLKKSKGYLLSLNNFCEYIKIAKYTKSIDKNRDTVHYYIQKYVTLETELEILYTIGDDVPILMNNSVNYDEKTNDFLENFKEWIERPYDKKIFISLLISIPKYTYIKNLHKNIEITSNMLFCNIDSFMYNENITEKEIFYAKLLLISLGLRLLNEINEKSESFSETTLKRLNMCLEAPNYRNYILLNRDSYSSNLNFWIDNYELIVGMKEKIRNSKVSKTIDPNSPLVMRLLVDTFIMENKGESTFLESIFDKFLEKMESLDILDTPLYYITTPIKKHVTKYNKELLTNNNPKKKLDIIFNMFFMAKKGLLNNSYSFVEMSNALMHWNPMNSPE